jgi:hypothetical protein
MRKQIFERRSKMSDQINKVALGILVEKYGDLRAVMNLLENVKSQLASAVTAARNGEDNVTFNGVKGTFVPNVWYDTDEAALKNVVGEDNFRKFFMKTSITQSNLNAAVKAEVLTEDQRKQLVTKKHGNRYLKITDNRDNPVTEENVAEVISSLIALLPNEEE